jgi:hypothetical protein
MTPAEQGLTVRSRAELDLLARPRCWPTLVGAGDVTELLEHQPDVVVLGPGRQRRFQVHPDTLSLLDRHGVWAPACPVGVPLRRGGGGDAPRPWRGLGDRSLGSGHK